MEKHGPNIETPRLTLELLLEAGRIMEDVSPELALRTIGSIHVLGALHLSPELKTALSSRIK